jgi:hypothetical protein
MVAPQFYPQQADGGVYFVQGAKTFHPDIVFVNPLASE